MANQPPGLSGEERTSALSAALLISLLTYRLPLRIYTNVATTTKSHWGGTLTLPCHHMAEVLHARQNKRRNRSISFVWWGREREREREKPRDRITEREKARGTRTLQSHLPWSGLDSRSRSRRQIKFLLFTYSLDNRSPLAVLVEVRIEALSARRV